MKLSVLTYNTLFAGRDGSDDRRAQAQIGMRGFLAITPRTGQNVAIFNHEPLHAVSFEADGAHFHHALKFFSTLCGLSTRFKRYLGAVSLFGIGDFFADGLGNACAMASQVIPVGGW